jgi:hypothetical protein
MKIGILSDTHLKEPLSEFKRMIEAHFPGVDKIIHAGDFVDMSVAEYLSSQKELLAVCGNMDTMDIRRTFPQKRMIKVKGFRVGLVHGGGSPFGIESRVKEQLDELARGDCLLGTGSEGAGEGIGSGSERKDLDVIIYGHTHIPANHQVRGILFFNPGSLTRSFIHRATLGILHIGEKIEGEIIKL